MRRVGCPGQPLTISVTALFPQSPFSIVDAAHPTSDFGVRNGMVIKNAMRVSVHRTLSVAPMPIVACVDIICYFAFAVDALIRTSWTGWTFPSMCS
ncbi:hypothetical protein Poly21_28630 [Allorhodopirellula heiligendammensis]|uniref:Uncharacterized protein n=1 Tax=Allorhodopirellula heiligendammensis TaxID=2714739 RepID=A0A5C6BWN0_9BACT|nr:hypothetical protein Poly21_28630 [Allorhodopirellula heiligendammensis]